MVGADDRFGRWLAAAEARYLADLTRAELGRALRALSSCYVERRGGLAQGRALEGRGKRAAFALYYGPLHFLTVRGIANALRPHNADPHNADTRNTDPHGSPPVVLDLGCGTGAAGAALALETGASVRGIDQSAWAAGEANWTYATLGVDGHARRGDIVDFRLPKLPATLLLAFVVNELEAGARDALLARLVDALGRGHHLVLVEPIARAVTPWWSQWADALAPLGAHAAEWRLPVDLPPLLRQLDASAGLDHRELTARTLVTGV